MSKHVFTVENGLFGLTLTAPTPGSPCAATVSAYSAFTCQITSGALTASPNVSQDTIPATWCDPEENVPKVAATSYSLEIAYLQDPDLVAGLSRFLYEHDAALGYFFMGMDGSNPPKAIGQVRFTSGAIGGEARTPLTATATLPCEGKPAVCFGDATTSAPVGGPVATGATAGTPGTFTPTGSTPPINLTAMATVLASPTTAWTTGQYVVTGDSAHVHWTSTAWANGPA